MMKKCLFAILASSLVAACVTTTGTKLDTSKIDGFTQGVTTIAQAEQVLGEPTGVAKNPDGSTTLTYFYSRSGMDAKSYIPFAGGFVGKNNMESSMTYVQFDARGRYIKWWGGAGAIPNG